MELKQGFSPIANKKAKVLILGSMPSEESFKKSEYYGNPRNYFWKIMAFLFGFDFSISYKEKIKILLENKIALWDVVQSCERKGSLDTNINNKTIIENDFVSFFYKHPNIKNVYFNGAKAEAEYYKRVLPMLSKSEHKINYVRLCSTSPAMTLLSFDAKLREWLKIKVH
ncbi:MAG: DNA-deoxyinosine glycosylase [Pseudomonadota bacterium]